MLKAAFVLVSAEKPLSPSLSPKEKERYFKKNQPFCSSISRIEYSQALINVKLAVSANVVHGMWSSSYLYSMEWIWIIIGIILAVVAIAGSILPLIPGPPIAYAGLLVQQLREVQPFSTTFLLIWAGIVVVSLVFDYFIPIWGTKKFGGTKYGVWGCTLGFLAAFWLGPWGIIIGPFVGAFIGEMMAQDNSKIAFKAALGSFVGFLMGSFLKLVICFFMLYYIVSSI